MTSRVIMVTSCKGGVGKSTVCANLGAALSDMGKRVLLIDLDLGMRCLDLILGCEDKAIYDIGDIIDGGMTPERAKTPVREGLDMIAAPYRKNFKPSPEDFSHFACELKKSAEYDYIIIDTPGDIGDPFALAAGVSDAAFIVASHAPSTIRAAEHTGRELERRGVKTVRLIINNFDISDSRGISRGERTGLVEIIDRTYLQLVGVIPHDEAFAREQEHGRLANKKTCRNVWTAFSNIAGRVEGKQIPVFDNFKKISRKKLL